MDIGKTYVAAGLVRYLREAGEPVSAFKPVMSGFDAASAAVSDAGVLLEALGEAATPAAIERLSPWRFAAPLSPDMAAERERRVIDFHVLVAWCRDRLASPGTVLLEGVGGVMVPLDDCHTVLDWIAQLNVPLVLVSGSYLGAISHTLTAVEVCRRRGLAIAALVINESEHSSVTLAETLASVSRFVGDVPVAMVQRVATGRTTKPNFARIWKIMKNI